MSYHKSIEEIENQDRELLKNRKSLKEEAADRLAELLYEQIVDNKEKH
jgi:hypothetical protein